LPNMTSRVGAGVLFVAIQCVVMLTTLDFLASISLGRFALGDTTGTTWGSLLATAQTQQALLTGTWWAFAFPAGALIVLAIGLVLVQYGLDSGSGPQLAGATRVPLTSPSTRRWTRIGFAPRCGCSSQKACSSVRA